MIIYIILAIIMIVLLLVSHFPDKMEYGYDIVKDKILKSLHHFITVIFFILCIPGIMLLVPAAVLLLVFMPLDRWMRDACEKSCYS